MPGILKYMKSDLFQTPRHVIAHGVNTHGVFGSGVAGKIGRRYPEVRLGYFRRHRRDGGWSPGDIQFVLTDDGRIVVNMATHETDGEGGCHVCYDAARMCFENLLDFCQKMGHGLAIPRIGAGLGEGWGQMESIVVDCLKTRNVEVDVHVIT